MHIWDWRPSCNISRTRLTNDNWLWKYNHKKLPQQYITLEFIKHSQSIYDIGVNRHVVIICCYAVYRVALKQPRGSYLVVNHSTSDIQVMSDRTVNLVLVPVELSTSLSVSHAATYVVNAYIPQMRAYLR